MSGSATIAATEGAFYSGAATSSTMTATCARSEKPIRSSVMASHAETRSTARATRILTQPSKLPQALRPTAVTPVPPIVATGPTDRSSSVPIGVGSRVASHQHRAIFRPSRVARLVTSPIPTCAVTDRRLLRPLRWPPQNKVGSSGSSSSA